MSDVISYFQRPRPVGRHVHLRLEPRHLVVDMGMKEAEISYGDIKSIRLLYEPKNITSSYRTRITLKSGRTVTFTTLDWKSFLDFQHRNVEYTAFVTELLRRAAAANPELVCISGRPPLLWALTTAVGVVTVTGMLAALVWALMLGFWTYVLVAAGFLAIFVFQIHGLIIRNKPGTFPAAHPPKSVMPPPES